MSDTPRDPVGGATEIIMSGVALFIAVGGSILAIVNHKRLRSSCCGKSIVMSLDVEATTPRDPVGGATPRDPAPHIVVQENPLPHG
jgi:hypothetical protein